ncbi:hypothetical protein GLOIN_2v1862261 [Rhizophagus irregularis DAOM 181602=DAOM 197198]|uniref:Uncharacterized protein n=1 Tax=Rhizophagus irregularis (strain DAOM 181602 / DAOM 197198 / MUCL 43194) TaxID=747089 RepID=A0A2P4PGR9_RHIID|nr:hypothetical protein GLOIN_2v1862261 [Rhizophagus irregularis DAOM 181602=DAOM 197198]POG64578.1 hypothetical protein GLOIN_2v1862261 [Rhizophagus irregularis DAOM 181602=DAOM 197198]|eukprot:XP_025171444.1 hypothetical protein GLOIN_2v1862261 [Rhizophagus irregularis DAOM 181602=DAOM 197198]
MVQPILIEPPEISGHFLLSIQNLVCIVNPTFVLFFVFLLSLFSTAYHIPSCICYTGFSVRSLHLSLRSRDNLFFGIFIIIDFYTSLILTIHFFSLMVYRH